MLCQSENCTCSILQAKYFDSYPVVHVITGSMITIHSARIEDLTVANPANRLVRNGGGGGGGGGRGGSCPDKVEHSAILCVLLSS